MIFRSSVAIVSLALVVSCAGVRGAGGGGGGGGGAGFGFSEPEFPSRDALASVAAQPAPPTPVDVERASAVTWMLAGPFPEHTGDKAIQGGDAVADFMLAALPPSSTSENLQCAAREVARFPSFPEPRLEAYVLMRCGASVSSAGGSGMSWSNVTAATTDAALLSADKDKLVELLHKSAADHALVGAALVRDNAAHTAHLTVLQAQPKVTLAAQAQTPMGGHVVIAGTLRASLTLDTIRAEITSGAYGAAECAHDDSQALPAFRFTCPVLAADASAYVEISAREHGRVLSTELASVLAVQSAGAATTWTRFEYVPLTATPETAAVGSTFLALLNAVRAKAGVAPVVQTAAESATAARLAPHYFAAAFADDRNGELLDTIALGLIAGWDVDDMVIRDAGFASLVDYAGQLDEMLGEALDQPSMRTFLLGKDASHVALGVHRINAKRVGLLVVGYQPVVVLEQKVAQQQVFDRINLARAARGLGPAGLIPVDDVMQAAAARLQKGEDGRAVANDVLSAAVNKMGRSMNMWWIDTVDVDHFIPPEALFSAQDTYVAMAVVQHRKSGAAWGSTEVVILYNVDRSAE
ncbi:MAG TPA: hypothetical protein VGO62_03635 [Myxococcota bacterium]|jgi:hypothetical protein